MSDVSSMQISAATFDASIGGLLLGVVFQAMTFGAASAFTWCYLRQSSMDPRWLRASILFAWLLCTFCMATTVHSLYFFTVKNFANPYALTTSPWSVCLITSAIGFVLMTVRLIFLSRVWRLYKSKGELNLLMALLLSLTAVLSVGDFAGGLVITVKLFSDPQGNALNGVRVVFEAMFGLGICSDILLAAMLCFCLHNSRTGLQRTDSVINLLIIYTINTALFPALITVIGLVMFLASRNTLLYVPFYIQVANLYLISLIASLNHREVVRNQIQKPLTLDFSAFERCTPPQETGDSDTISTLSLPPSLTHGSLATSTWHSDETSYLDLTMPETEKAKTSDELLPEIDLSDIERGEGRHMRIHPEE